jgi:prephenate dehydrogenase
VKVGVVGLGLIGGSVLRGLGAGARGHDADASVRAAAAGEGFEVSGGLDGLAGCELVIVAVPPRHTAEVVAAALAAAPEAMVADTASVKAPVIDAVPEAARERFVGAHPLAGAETAGWQASDATVVAGAVWAVCPAGESVEPVCRLSAALERLDGRLVACEAAAHDDAVARTSHAPHVVAVALAALAGDGVRASVSGTAFRDMTRVARADRVLWSDILTANRERAVGALDELAERLAVLRGALADGDPDALAAEWERAGGALGAVDAARWAQPRWEEGTVAGGWAGLLELGRAGRAVRRLREVGGVLHAEVAA